jgi:hypothetical protein
MPYALIDAPIKITTRWLDLIEEACRQPISSALQLNLKQIERQIEYGIAARGDGVVTDDECLALLAVRNYQGQCDAVIPAPQPYIPPPPKPKASRKPPMELMPWEETMDADEVRFCEQAIAEEVRRIGAYFVDNHRAARMWKSSQRKRFRKQREQGCCGSHDFVAQRWSPEKNRHDLYLLGFNYGH